MKIKKGPQLRNDGNFGTRLFFLLLLISAQLGCNFNNPNPPKPGPKSEPIGKLRTRENGGQQTLGVDSDIFQTYAVQRPVKYRSQGGNEGGLGPVFDVTSRFETDLRKNRTTIYTELLKIWNNQTNRIDASLPDGKTISIINIGEKLATFNTSFDGFQVRLTNDEIIASGGFFVGADGETPYIIVNIYWLEEYVRSGISGGDALVAVLGHEYSHSQNRSNRGESQEHITDIQIMGILGFAHDINNAVSCSENDEGYTTGRAEVYNRSYVYMSPEEQNRFNELVTFERVRIELVKRLTAKGIDISERRERVVALFQKRFGFSGDHLRDPRLYMWYIYGKDASDEFLRGKINEIIVDPVYPGFEINSHSRKLESIK